MDQLKKLSQSLSPRQRLAILAAVVVCAGAIWTLTDWRRAGDFKPLYTSMAPEDAGAVVQKLKESGVAYRLGDGGGTVLVPSAKVAEARLELAAAGLPKSGRMGFELFDKTNFGATEFVEHINYQRALEGELERSMMALAEVEQARVHLTFAKESVFLESAQPAKASVMLRLRPGARLQPQNVGDLPPGRERGGRTGPGGCRGPRYAWQPAQQPAESGLRARPAVSRISGTRAPHGARPGLQNQRYPGAAAGGGAVSGSRCGRVRLEQRGAE